MPNKFHRFFQPSYFGAPSLASAPTYTTWNGVQYDFLNVVSGGVGASGSAYMHDYKSSGPNTGARVLTFGEQLESGALNRGIRALAENTDMLDDWLHRDVAVPARTATVTAGAPVTSLVLPAGTYVGTGVGYPLDMLFSILDSDGEEILNGDSKVDVASISGAVVGSGFSAGAVTLTLSNAIPTGTTYYVIYASRSNLATLPTDALVSVGIRASEEVAADVRRMIGHLKGEPATAWDANPTFNLFDIGSSGLNGLYRRSTTAESFTLNPDVTGITFDTPGAGAEILADGRALSSVMTRAYAGYTPDLRYADPFQALIRAEDEGAPAGGLGRAGIVSLMAGPDTTETVKGSAGGLSVYRRMGAGTYTVVNEGGSATLELQAMTTQVLDITLGTSMFAGPGGTTALRVGYDLLKVRLPATIDGNPTLGDRDITLRIISAFSTGVSCVGLDARLPTQLAGLAAPITVTVLGWYSTAMALPNGVGSMRLNANGADYNFESGVKDSALTFFPQKPNTAAQAAFMDGPAIRAFGTATQPPLEWGRETGTGMVVNGSLRDDGEVNCTRAYANSVRANLAAMNMGVERAARFSGTYTKTPRVYVNYTGAASATAMTFVFDSNIIFTPGGLNGDRTDERGAGGAKYPGSVFIQIRHSANITIHFRFPFRDAVIGDEIKITLSMIPTAANYAFQADEYYELVSATPYASWAQKSDGTSWTDGSNTRKLYTLTFRCAWCGTMDDGITRTALWVLQDSKNFTVSLDTDGYLNKQEGIDGDDVVVNMTTAGGVVNLNQGW